MISLKQLRSNPRLCDQVCNVPEAEEGLSGIAQAPGLDAVLDRMGQ